jgi:putative polyketide hydroxylase
MHDVIIIGGGPVGLSAAIGLAQMGIRSVLIEQHAAITQHPKARYLNGRSMEIYRSWGLDSSYLKQHSMPQDAHGFTWINDLQSEDIARVQSTGGYHLYSPIGPAIIGQDDLEHELFKKAACSPLIDLRFNHKMVSITQDNTSVMVNVLHQQNNDVLHASYVIAADGAHSTIRQYLNITMDGIDNLGVFLSMHCEMDLDKYTAHRPSAAFVFTKPDVRGTMLFTKKGLRQWLVLKRITSTDQPFWTDHRCMHYVQSLINDTTVKVNFLSKTFWTMASLVATSYQAGRIFLAGDAAHRLPPTGGFGMNTGIQDVHNLTWKLAMVLKDQAQPSLLDTYFTERVNVAHTNAIWSRKNAKRIEDMFIALAQNDWITFKACLNDQTHPINHILLDLGFVYGYDYSNDTALSVITGARAPHVWLLKNHDVSSILDRYGSTFVLVCHPNARHFQLQFAAFPCSIVTIGKYGDYLDQHDDFLKKYKITEKGAVLVRPDGHIAWHAHDEHETMACSHAYCIKE